jgi:hypothetical protein
MPNPVIGSCATEPRPISREAKANVKSVFPRSETELRLGQPKTELNATVSESHNLKYSTNFGSYPLLGIF